LFSGSQPSFFLVKFFAFVKPLVKTGKMTKENFGCVLYRSVYLRLTLNSQIPVFLDNS
jgi:hypothetical protein